MSRLAKILLFILALNILLIALSGCAICQKHELACAVAIGIAAGSIVASTNQRTQPVRVSIEPVHCAGSNCR